MTAGLGAWLESLPSGLDTELGTNWRLSAGEAQLLAYARVFLRNPGVIVLDEATSRLDPVTQRLIEVAMRNLLRDRTAIVVAHRLTTLDAADLIAVMEDGRIVRRRVPVKLIRSGLVEKAVVRKPFTIDAANG